MNQCNSNHMNLILHWHNLVNKYKNRKDGSSWVGERIEGNWEGKMRIAPLYKFRWIWTKWIQKATLLEQRSLLIKLINPNRILTEPLETIHVLDYICKLHLQVAAPECSVIATETQEKRDPLVTLLTTSQSNAHAFIFLIFTPSWFLLPKSCFDLS